MTCLEAFDRDYNAHSLPNFEIKKNIFEIKIWISLVIFKTFSDCKASNGGGIYKYYGQCIVVKTCGFKCIATSNTGQFL